jgi:tetratricopeptide (TPR) repeat protein
VNRSNKQAKSVSPRPAALFYIILILIPLLFFVLLEGGLRIFNYGHDLSQWNEAPGGKLLLNPEIAYRYFYSTKGIPYSSGDVFNKVKAKNCFRIFVIGESSAAGYPFSPNGSFAKYIRKRVRLVNPGKEIEVINISMAAINSYALHDLFPGILEQKPDLVICYTGHNEYYGALGVGSAESLGGYRSVVKVMLFMNRFKTTQLVRDALKSLLSLFSNEKIEKGTLMSRMANDQQILFNSDTYRAGIEQFRENMEDIVSLSSDAGVPFVIGTLISNLKDQPPFISAAGNNLPAASEIYNNGVTELKNGNIGAADSLFRFAKDLDGLRFRASEDLNNIIRSFADNKKIFLADIDAAFKNIAPGGIIGNEYMTDHLHPTLAGYQLIGKIFTEKMEQYNLLPEEKNIAEGVQDSLTVADYDFSKLDSVIARYRIITLKSDWPYVKNPKPVSEVLKEINPLDYTDTLALLVVDNKLQWEQAHRKLAVYYLENKNFPMFLKEMDVVIDQYPFIPEYYINVTRVLIDKLQFELALPYLYKYYELKPDAFSAKWTGIIHLSNGKVKEAVKYLEYSKRYNSTDPQVLYNLAGAYALNKQYDKALAEINRTLEINRNNAEAQNLKQQLIEINKKIEAEKTN